jgi:hypothetical protein
LHRNLTGRRNPLRGLMLLGSLLLSSCCLDDYHPPPTGEWIVASGSLEAGLYGPGTETRVVGGHLEFGEWRHSHTIVLQTTYAGDGRIQTDSIARSGGSYFEVAGACEPGGPGESSLLMFDGPGKVYDKSEVSANEDRITQDALLSNGSTYKRAVIVWIRRG